MRPLQSIASSHRNAGIYRTLWIALAFCSTSAWSADKIPLTFPPSFFDGLCRESMMDWETASLPEGRREVLAGDDKLIDAFAGRIQIIDNRTTKSTKPDAAPEILRWQAERLKIRGLTPTERDLFQFAVDSQGEFVWTPYTGNSGANRYGVILAPLLEVPVSWRRYRNVPLESVLSDEGRRRLKQAKLINPYQTLLHELFHFRTHGLTGHHGIYESFFSLHPQLFGYTILFEEILANRAAFGSLRKAIEVTYELYQPTLNLLRENYRFPENFDQWSPEQVLEYFQQRSNQTQAILYRSFQVAMSIPTLRLKTNWRTLYPEWSLDRLLLQWKLADDHEPVQISAQRLEEIGRAIATDLNKFATDVRGY